MGMASTWGCGHIDKALSTELLSYQNGRRITSDVLHSFSLSLELVYRDLLIQQMLDGLDHSGEQACEFIRQVLLSVQEMQDLVDRVSTSYLICSSYGCCG